MIIIFYLYLKLLTSEFIILNEPPLVINIDNKFVFIFLNIEFFIVIEPINVIIIN